MNKAITRHATMAAQCLEDHRAKKEKIVLISNETIVITLLFLLFLTDGLMVAYMKVEELEKREKNIKKFVGIQLILVVLGGVATLALNRMNEKQMGDVKDTLNANYRLTKEVERLERIDNDLTTHINTITTESKNLTERNIVLTDSLTALAKVIKGLLGTVDRRTEKAYAENALTGKMFFKFSKPLKAGDKINLNIGGYNVGETIPKNSPDNFGFMPVVVIGRAIPVDFKVIDRRLTVSLTAYDLDGHWIADVVDNYWRRNPNYTGKFNYDDSGFEIMDNKGQIVFNINIESNNEIKVQGIFPLKSEGRILIAGKGSRPIPAPTQVNIDSIYKLTKMTYEKFYLDAVTRLKVTQLFEYTGERWIGKRRIIR